MNGETITVMKKLKIVVWIVALLLACCVLAGCGAASANGSVGAAPAAPQENYEVAVGESTTASDADGSLLPEAGGRKLVYTASLDLETKTYPDARDALLAALDKAGGYVESNEEGGSAERGTRWSRMTLRVPADRYAAFLAEASGVGNLVQACWAYGLADGTDKYMGLVGSAGNMDWSFTAKGDAGASVVAARGGLGNYRGHGRGRRGRGRRRGGDRDHL